MLIIDTDCHVIQLNPKTSKMATAMYLEHYLDSEFKLQIYMTNYMSKITFLSNLPIHIYMIRWHIV